LFFKLCCSGQFWSDGNRYGARVSTWWSYPLGQNEAAARRFATGINDAGSATQLLGLVRKMTRESWARKADGLQVGCAREKERQAQLS
jgi:hypothetical protein